MARSKSVSSSKKAVIHSTSIHGGVGGGVAADYYLDDLVLISTAPSVRCVLYGYPDHEPEQNGVTDYIGRCMAGPSDDALQKEVHVRVTRQTLTAELVIEPTKPVTLKRCDN